ncbi:MAG: NRAMP family divalent metal transporter [Opitutales bacterium]
MKPILKSIGPAIIVAAVVLGPGSILTSSKVGATFGIAALPVIAGATVLMIAMVALAARLGVVYKSSLCDELSARLGKPITIAIGLILFVLVALFQSSNNIALVGGIESLSDGKPLSLVARAAILVGVNLFVIVCLYRLRNLYSSIEKVMKVLIGLMVLAFLINFLVVFLQPQGFEPTLSNQAKDWLPLLAMIGTTFSVGGAFYQAYLVKEKGWGLSETRQGLTDSILSISILGIVTAIILLTSWRVFYGQTQPVNLASVGDIARQLEPLFGPSAKIIFCAGILGGALSSFLVNAMIGGTVLSDSLGMGSKLKDRGPILFTTIALIVGLLVALASLAKSGSVVSLITLAQALTVLGIPALAFTLIYLGTRKELTGESKVPRGIIILAIIGFVISCVLASLTAKKIYEKLSPPEQTESRS